MLQSVVFFVCRLCHKEDESKVDSFVSYLLHEDSHCFWGFFLLRHANVDACSKFHSCDFNCLIPALSVAVSWP